MNTIQLTFQQYVLYFWERGRGCYFQFTSYPTDEEVWENLRKRVNERVLKKWKEEDDPHIRYELFKEYNVPGSTNKPYRELVKVVHLQPIDIVERIPTLRLKYILED